MFYLYPLTIRVRLISRKRRSKHFTFSFAIHRSRELLHCFPHATNAIFAPSVSHIHHVAQNLSEEASLWQHFSPTAVAWKRTQCRDKKGKHQVVFDDSNLLESVLRTVRYARKQQKQTKKRTVGRVCEQMRVARKKMGNRWLTLTAVRSIQYSARNIELKRFRKCDNDNCTSVRDKRSVAQVGVRQSTRTSVLSLVCASKRVM